MADEIKLLDVVALLQDIPEEGLRRGEVGTVVEELAHGVYLVEFIDDLGQTQALPTVDASLLLPLLYPAQSSSS